MNECFLTSGTRFRRLDEETKGGGIERDGWTIEKCRQTAVGGKLSRTAREDGLAWLHKPKTVGKLKGKFYVVGGKEDGLARVVSKGTEKL